MKQTELIERNRRLVADLQSMKRGEVAKKYGISYSQTYRAEKSLEQFQAAVPVTSTNLYSQLASTGLKRYGGNIDDDYNRVFRSLSSRVALYREMGDDPIVGATLQAIKMTLRRLRWRAEPQGEGKADQEAGKWLETCLDDMSQSWSDTVDQALGMVQYGFQVGEIVYKKRTGYSDNPEKPSSKYDDGKVGWRKMVFAAPESLAAGQAWVFDENGGLQAWEQVAPPDYRTITVPIDKSILFRTTTEKGNPEGRSILRAMYPAWYFKKNLEEIEAISAERMGAGLPVVYMGKGTSKSGNSGDDLDTLKTIVGNIRADEQMGVVLPWPKLGLGAEGEGVLFELMSPPSRGIINFHETIQRYEQRMAMVALAQFIHLGMNQVGARALGESSTDFFTLAVSAWADSMADTFNRYAVERLFRLNNFPGLEQIPVLKHETIGRLTLGEIAEYVNKLVNAQVIKPTPELETELLKLVELPQGTPPEVVTNAPGKPQDGQDGETGENDTDDGTKAAGRPAVDEGGEDKGDITVNAERSTVTTTADAFVAPHVDVHDAGPKLDDLFSDLRYAIRLAEQKDAAPVINVTTPQHQVDVKVHEPNTEKAIAQMSDALGGKVDRMADELRNQKPPVVNVEQPAINMAAPNVTVNTTEQPAPSVTVNVQPFSYEKFAVSMAESMRPVLEPIGRAMTAFSATAERFSVAVSHPVAAVQAFRHRRDVQKVTRDAQGRVTGSETETEYQE